MLELIHEFPAQLRKALEIGEKAGFKIPPGKTYNNVLICGMGGSGIGGNLVAELLSDTLGIPVIVNKSYFLPAFAGPDTLMIASSYSGNTEETITVTRQALERNMQPVCVTSGGQLAEIARANNLNLIEIPGGFPPRACLGFSATQLFYVLHYYGLINAGFKEALKGVAALLESENEATSQAARELAAKLLGKVIIAYAEDKYESTALRLKQQINENSKMYCWYNTVPEMNHNELVGWREPNDALAVLQFHTDDAYSRNVQRIAFKREVVSQYAAGAFDVWAKGDNLFEKHFYLINFGDWLSYHLAALKGIDVVEVTVIDNLKSHLNAIK